MHVRRWALSLAFVLLAAGAARAEGTFIPAADRADIVYDDARGVLYITNGGEVLRYRLSTGSFMSPLALGGHLKGAALSPDGNTLAVADADFDEAGLTSWIHLVDLNKKKDQKVTFPIGAHDAGTFAVAYGNDGTVLVTSDFQGSGDVPIRRYDPATEKTKLLRSVGFKSMINANAGGSVIALASANSSDGPYGAYIVDKQKLRIRRFSKGVQSFTYEVGVNRDASIYALPTDGGTFIADKKLKLTSTKIGAEGEPQPIAAVFHPTRNLVYFPWAMSREVKVFSTKTWTEVGSFDFENDFANPHFSSLVTGREKLSADGSLLFVTVDGGVRYVSTAGVR